MKISIINHDNTRGWSSESITAGKCFIFNFANSTPWLEKKKKKGSSKFCPIVNFETLILVKLNSQTQLFQVVCGIGFSSGGHGLSPMGGAFEV